MVRLTIARALGISAMSLLAAGIAVTSAPHAAADTDCGTSSHGASVSAGPNTSCGYALDAAETPVGKFSEVDVTDSTTGQTQTITPVSANRQSLSDDELVYKICEGNGVVVTHADEPGAVGIICDSGLSFYRPS